MTFFRSPLRMSILLKNIKYHAQKNKQLYTQQSCKRPLHTDPPSPPYISFIFVLGLIIYQHNSAFSYIIDL